MRRPASPIPGYRAQRNGGVGPARVGPIRSLGGVDDGVGADWEGAEAFDGRRGRVEVESLGRQLVEAAEVLDDGDAGRQEDRVGGAGAVLDGVDVDRVDAHERGMANTERVPEPAGRRGPAVAPSRVNDAQVSGTPRSIAARTQ